MKYVLWGLTSLIVATAIWYFTSWTQESLQLHLAQTNSHTTGQTAMQQPVVHPLSAPKQKPLPAATLTKQQEQPSHHEVTMYLLENEVVAQSLKPRPFVKPISAITIDQAKLQSLQPGDILMINDLEDHDYQVAIKNVVKKGEDTIISGSYMDEGIQYRLLVTTSSSGTTFMHLDAPQKNYEIEMEGSQGYLYDTMQIRRQLSDESKDDFIVKHVVPKEPS